MRKRGRAKDGRRDKFRETNSAAELWSWCDRVEFVVVDEVRLRFWFSRDFLFRKLLRKKAQFGGGRRLLALVASDTEP